MESNYEENYEVLISMIKDANVILNVEEPLTFQNVGSVGNDCTHVVNSVCQIVGLALMGIISITFLIFSVIVFCFISYNIFIGNRPGVPGYVF